MSSWCFTAWIVASIFSRTVRYARVAETRIGEQSRPHPASLRNQRKSGRGRVHPGTIPKPFWRPCEARMVCPSWQGRQQRLRKGPS